MMFLLSVLSLHCHRQQQKSHTVSLGGASGRPQSDSDEADSGDEGDGDFGDGPVV